MTSKDGGVEGGDISQFKSQNFSLAASVGCDSPI